MALAVAVALGCTGCYSTWDIAPAKVNALDGYRAPAPRSVPDMDGHAVEVDQDTELTFLPKSPTSFYFKDKVEAIDIHNAPGQWWASVVIHPEGTRASIDLNEVQKVVARRYSHGKTAGLVIGVVLGVVALGGTAAILVAGVATARAGDLARAPSRSRGASSLDGEPVEPARPVCQTPPGLVALKTVPG